MRVMSGVALYRREKFAYSALEDMHAIKAVLLIPSCRLNSRGPGNYAECSINIPESPDRITGQSWDCNTFSWKVYMCWSQVYYYAQKRSSKQARARVWNRNCRLPKLSQQWQLRLDTNKIQNVILAEKVDLEALLLPKFLGIYLAFLWFLRFSAGSLREVDDWSKKAKCFFVRIQDCDSRQNITSGRLSLWYCWPVA